MGRLQGREFRLRPARASKDGLKLAVGCAVLTIPFVAMFGFSSWVLWQAATTGIIEGFGGRFRPARPVPLGDTLNFWALTTVWSLLLVTGAVMAVWLCLMTVDSYEAYRKYRRRSVEPDQPSR